MLLILIPIFIDFGTKGCMRLPISPSY